MLKRKRNQLAYGIVIFLLQLCLISVEAVPSVGIDGDQTQFVATDSGMRLTCQYHALPQVSEVQWRKDGTVIARNTSVEMNKNNEQQHEQKQCIHSVNLVLSTGLIM